MVTTTKVNRIIVVIAHKNGLGLLADFSDEGLKEFFTDCIGKPPDYIEQFAMSSFDCVYPGDGVWSAKVTLEDDGPGDYPGTREVCMTLSDWLPITQKEWLACTLNERPWNEGE